MTTTRVLLLGMALAMALALAACNVTVGSEGDTVTATWDLRTTHAIEAVGWPASAEDLSAFEATTAEGLERILLPEDVEVTGSFRANVSRDGGLVGRDFDDQVRSLVVTFDEEPVADVLDRARAYGTPLGVDLAPVADWAEANSGGQATGAGEATATTGSVPLGDGATLSLATRAFPGGEAVLRLEVLWTD